MGCGCNQERPVARPIRKPVQTATEKSASLPNDTRKEALSQDKKIRKLFL